MKSNIKNSELVVLEGCSHGGLYEKTEEFNQKSTGLLEKSLRVRIKVPGSWIVILSRDVWPYVPTNRDRESRNLESLTMIQSSLLGRK